MEGRAQVAVVMVWVQGMAMAVRGRLLRRQLRQSDGRHRLCLQLGVVGAWCGVVVRILFWRLGSQTPPTVNELPSIKALAALTAVSYTHLTLPTTD